MCLPFLIVLLVGIQVHNIKGQFKNYCDVCPNHVACPTTKMEYSECESAELISIRRCWALDPHNDVRNKLAGGKAKNLPPACRMATLQWDNELAYLAMFSVQQCQLATDKCIKTKRFSDPGQNIGQLTFRGVPNVKALVRKQIYEWFKFSEEYKEEDLKSFKERGKQDTFAQLILDRNTHVGCFASIYINKDTRRFLMTCNYGTKIKKDDEVYEGCKVPGKKCNIKSEQYKNLCCLHEYDGDKFWDPDVPAAKDLTPPGGVGQDSNSNSTSGSNSESNAGTNSDSNSGWGSQSNSGWGSQSNSGWGSQSNSGWGSQSNSGWGSHSNSGWGSGQHTGQGAYSGSTNNWNLLFNVPISLSNETNNYYGSERENNRRRPKKDKNHSHRRCKHRSDHGHHDWSENSNRHHYDECDSDDDDYDWLYWLG